jgi:signal transduction histidine kinase
MGQLTASIAHEVSQPISAVVTNAQTGLRWLRAKTPDLGEVQQSLELIIRDATRASDVLGRLRALMKKDLPRKEGLDINEAIGEVIELTRSEALKSGVSVEMDLANGLPLVEGDRVQLQQVVLNLVVNSVQRRASHG